MLEWRNRGLKTNRDLLHLMVNGIAHGFIMSEALQAVCGKAQLDQNHPELNKIFEKVKQNQHEQITLSCSSEKPESKS